MQRIFYFLFFLFIYFFLFCKQIFYSRATNLNQIRGSLGSGEQKSELFMRGSRWRGGGSWHPQYNLNLLDLNLKLPKISPPPTNKQIPRTPFPIPAKFFDPRMPLSLFLSRLLPAILSGICLFISQIPDKDGRDSITQVYSLVFLNGIIRSDHAVNANFQQ